MRKIYLTGLGWVDEPNQPSGMRLRWLYPFEDFGFPKEVLVERVLIYAKQEDNPTDVARDVPTSWWRYHGDVMLDEMGALRLDQAQEGIRFRYGDREDHHAVFVEVYDATDSLIEKRLILSGEQVSFYGQEIRSLRLYAREIFDELPERLQDFQMLDLFEGHRLSGWKPIAKINPEASLSLSFEEIQRRYAGYPLAFSREDWEAFKQLGRAALNGEEEAIESLMLALSVRWEFALVMGMGYYDGRQIYGSRADWQDRQQRLETPNDALYVYRVTIDGVRSNLFPLRARHLAPLLTPHSFDIDQAMVNFDPTQEHFTASYGVGLSSLVFNGGDRLEVDEVWKGSDYLRTPSKHTTYIVQPQESVGDRLHFTHHASVDFYDVSFRIRLRLMDNWDRVSGYTHWSHWQRLDFEHTAEAPWLKQVRYAEGGRVTLIREKSWKPDRVVKSDSSAKVLVYRRKIGALGEPRSMQVTIEALELLGVDARGVGHYRIGFVEHIDQGLFREGFLSQASTHFKIKIETINSHGLYFETQQDTRLPDLGSATLTQDANDLRLWEHVAGFNPNNLPIVMEFDDPLPPSQEELVRYSYQLRLQTFGVLDSPSNTVEDFVLPPTPKMAPPFVVTTLGVDFYHRTMIDIRFLYPCEGRYRIYWMEGKVTQEEEFTPFAVEGLKGIQEVLDGYYLYDLLPLVLRQREDQDTVITLGIRRENSGGETSPFRLVHFNPLVQHA